MSVPSSGPVSLADIRNEFGAPAGTPLHDFVRGGSWVPNIGANNGVPTSPPVSIDDLRGAINVAPIHITGIPSITLSGGAPIKQGGRPDTGTTQVSFSGGSGTISYSWAYVSGSTSIYGTGSGSTCTFSAAYSVSGSATWRVTVSDGNSSDSATFTVTAP